jgi:hypothetical protein
MMVFCASLILSIVWKGGPDEFTILNQFVITSFVLGLASFLIWFVTIVFEIKDKIEKEKKEAEKQAVLCKKMTPAKLTADPKCKKLCEENDLLPERPEWCKVNDMDRCAKLAKKEPLKVKDDEECKKICEEADDAYENETNISKKPKIPAWCANANPKIGKIKYALTNECVGSKKYYCFIDRNTGKYQTIDQNNNKFYVMEDTTGGSNYIISGPKGEFQKADEGNCIIQTPTSLKSSFSRRDFIGCSDSNAPDASNCTRDTSLTMFSGVEYIYLYKESFPIIGGACPTP